MAFLIGVFIRGSGYIIFGFHRVLRKRQILCLNGFVFIAGHRISSPINIA